MTIVFYANFMLIIVPRALICGVPSHRSKPKEVWPRSTGSILIVVANRLKAPRSSTEKKVHSCNGVSYYFVAVAEHLLNNARMCVKFTTTFTFGHLCKFVIFSTD